jgi:hypothetical protein
VSLFGTLVVLFLQSNFKQTIMKNLFEKQSTALDFGSLSTILSSGATAAMAIAHFAGKDKKTAGMIGAGLSLLVTGLIAALDDDSPKHNFNNN